MAEVVGMDCKNLQENVLEDLTYRVEEDLDKEDRMPLLIILLMQ